jgi:ATP synthase subunit 6
MNRGGFLSNFDEIISMKMTIISSIKLNIWNPFESFEIHVLLPNFGLNSMLIPMEEISPNFDWFFAGYISLYESNVRTTVDFTDLTLVFITLLVILLNFILIKLIKPYIYMAIDELILFPIESTRNILTEDLYHIFVLPLIALFIVVLWGNVYGLFPHAFSTTGHIAVTFTLSVMVFVAWMILGLYKLGWHFWSIFLPHETPNWLFPLMVVVEIMSYFIRPFSLAIRLFANILAGHILLHIISDNRHDSRTSEIWSGLYMNFLTPNGSSIFITLILTAVYLLEGFVAFLQAYIFMILSSLYAVDSVAQRTFPSMHIETKINSNLISHTKIRRLHLNQLPVRQYSTKKKDISETSNPVDRLESILKNLPTKSTIHLVYNQDNTALTEKITALAVIPDKERSIVSAKLQFNFTISFVFYVDNTKKGIVLVGKNITGRELVGIINKKIPVHTGDTVIVFFSKEEYQLWLKGQVLIVPTTIQNFPNLDNWFPFFIETPVAMIFINRLVRNEHNHVDINILKSLAEFKSFQDLVAHLNKLVWFNNIESFENSLTPILREQYERLKSYKRQKPQVPEPTAEQITALENYKKGRIEMAIKRQEEKAQKKKEKKNNQFKDLKSSPILTYAKSSMDMREMDLYKESNNSSKAQFNSKNNSYSYKADTSKGFNINKDLNSSPIITMEKDMLTSLYKESNNSSKAQFNKGNSQFNKGNSQFNKGNSSKAQFNSKNNSYSYKADTSKGLVPHKAQFKSKNNSSKGVPKGEKRGK